MAVLLVHMTAIVTADRQIRDFMKVSFICGFVAFAVHTVYVFMQAASVTKICGKGPQQHTCRGQVRVLEVRLATSHPRLPAACTRRHTRVAPYTPSLSQRRMPCKCRAQWVAAWLGCLWVAEICWRELQKPPVPNKGGTWATYELTNLMKAGEDSSVA